MVASKTTLFVAFAFLGSTGLILFSKQLDNGFARQRNYAPKIVRVASLYDKELRIIKGIHFHFPNL